MAAEDLSPAACGFTRNLLRLSASSDRGSPSSYFGELVLTANAVLTGEVFAVAGEEGVVFDG